MLCVSALLTPLYESSDQAGEGSDRGALVPGIVQHDLLYESHVVVSIFLNFSATYHGSYIQCGADHRVPPYGVTLTPILVSAVGMYVQTGAKLARLYREISSMHY